LATYPPSEERAYFEHTRVGRLDGAEQLLSQIKDLLPGCGRVLDIGCGDGVFLAVAQARGWDVFGIEASEHLVAALNAGAMAGRVMYGRAESFCAGPCEYDLVVLLNVLEHLREPMRALRNAVQALRPGGVLAVHVPNYAWGRAYGRHWAQLEPLDHLYYWTPRTLSTALVQVGLSPVARFSLPGTSRWRAQIQRGINAIGLWPGSGLGWLARKANRRT